MKLVNGKLVPDDFVEGTPGNEPLPTAIPSTVHPTTVIPSANAFVANSEGSTDLGTTGDGSIIEVKDEVNPLKLSDEEIQSEAHQAHLASLLNAPVSRERIIENNAKEKSLLHGRIVAILNDYGGLESNIPLGHEYWDLLNRYRGLNRN